MQHHLVVTLPLALCSSPLGSAEQQSLNSLSIKAIYLEFPDSSVEPMQEKVRKNLQPYPILHPEQNGERVRLIPSFGDAIPAHSPLLSLRAGRDPDRNELLPTLFTGDLLRWLDAQQPKWLVVPLGTAPVIRAILNIHPFDPYLAAHYFRQYTPLDQALTPADLDQLARRFMAREHLEPSALSEAAQAYLKLERKLHRQYGDEA